MFGTIPICLNALTGWACAAGLVGGNGGKTRSHKKKHNKSKGHNKKKTKGYSEVGYEFSLLCCCFLQLNDEFWP